MKRWLGRYLTEPMSGEQSRTFYHDADLFVVPPSVGHALAVGETSRWPMLTINSSETDDMVNQSCGRIVPLDDLDSLLESLRWFNSNRGRVPELARRKK